MCHLTYNERSRNHPNPVVRKLFTLMDSKKTNLAVAADVTCKDRLMDLAEKLGPEICILKVHIDMIENFDQGVIEKLLDISKRHEFLLLEDRKYADIGNTTKLQYSGGVHKVAKWADIVTAHSIPGEGIIKGLRNGARDSQEPRGVVLISSMSTEDALIDENGDYEKRTYAMAYRNRDFVMGFISQRPIKDSGASDVADFITMTPGVSISSSGDELGQKYRTPQECILEVGSDVIIVGRAIIESIDPVKEARKYRELGWEAYRRKIII